MVNSLEKVEELVNGYVGRVPSLVRGMVWGLSEAEVEDIVADCNSRLFSAARRYDSSKGASFETYAYGSVRCEVREWFRTKARHSHMLKLDNLEGEGDGLYELISGTSSECGEEILDSEKSRRIFEFLSSSLNKLGEVDREIVTRHYDEGETLKEIAASIVNPVTGRSYSEMRICQRNMGALKTLKRAFHSMGLTAEEVF